MTAKKTLVLALAALATAGGSAALADVRASDDKRGDAKCDSRPCADLKSAVANPAPLDPTSLFYIVTQYNAVQKSRLPRVAINTRGSSTSAPEFYVEKRGSRTGVFNAKTDRKVGAAELSSSSRTTLSWTIARKAIGNPSSYLWRVEVVAKGSRIDATPNSGYLKHIAG
jgi:hypothetical protein